MKFLGIVFLLLSGVAHSSIIERFEDWLDLHGYNKTEIRFPVFLNWRLMMNILMKLIVKI